MRQQLSPMRNAPRPDGIADPLRRLAVFLEAVSVSWLAAIQDRWLSWRNALVSSPAVKSVLLEEPMIQEQLAVARKADKIIFGVGATRPGGSAYDGGLIEQAKAAFYLRRRGAAIVAGRFIDEGGAAIHGPLDERMIGLSLEEIARIRTRIAVAGGMELALWCDLRVVEEDAYFGVYCRRFGVPLIDGGTVRLPRLVGMGHAMDLILTGRKVEAAEALRIGLANRVVPPGQARAAAIALAEELAKFPQATMLADRMNAYLQWDQPLPAALAAEWDRSRARIPDALEGAARFAAGAGRHGESA